MTTVNYQDLITQLDFSFKKKRKTPSSFIYSAAINECSEVFIKTIAKYPNVNINDIAKATKTINDFNFVCSKVFPFEKWSMVNVEENNRAIYIDIIESTRNKNKFIQERLFNSFEGF